MSSEIPDSSFPPVRDLDAERETLQRMIDRQPNASKAYNAGKFNVGDRGRKTDG